MPRPLPRHLKAISSIAQEPREMTAKIELITLLEISGRRSKDIAAAVGMTPERVSRIRSSPLYLDNLKRETDKLKEQFHEKKAEQLVTGDPVENLLKSAALAAAKTKIELMENGRSEFVKLAASGDILDRAGYKAREDKTLVSVTITEKMSDRFERALKYGHSTTNGRAEAKDTEELS